MKAIWPLSPARVTPMSACPCKLVSTLVVHCGNPFRQLMRSAGIVWRAWIPTLNSIQRAFDRRGNIKFSRGNHTKDNRSA